MPARAPLIDGASLRELTAARRHDDACDGARALVAAGTADREVRYLLALNLRLLNRIDEALEVLDEFEALHPEFSRIQQERAHCHLARREHAAAIQCFERAVAMNPALRDSWQRLAMLHSRDTPSRALDAAARAAQLAALPPELLRAESLCADGDLDQSEAILRRLLEERPGDRLVLHLLARVRHRCGALLDAQCLYEEALAQAPGLETIRLDYVRLLLDRQTYAAAQRQLLSLETEASTPVALLMQGTAWTGLGESAQAVSTLRRLIEIEPSPVAWLSLGDALRAEGLHDDCIDAYGHAAQRGAYAAACWSLANLKTYRFAPGEVQEMQAALAAPAGPDEREALHFALGSVLRQLGDHATSWRHFEHGNALHRAHHAYQVRHDEALVEALTATCDARFFAARADWGISDGDPIFIVGLPRSGSTLVEQILASHSKVDGTRELGELPAIVHDLGGRHPERLDRRYPRNLGDLDAASVATLARTYLNGTRPYRGSCERFTDKLPNNFLHVGLIHLMMPGAKIIDVRRNAMDCCFSNLTQRYAAGQEFSYDVADMARFYQLYEQLLQHWHTVLPGRVLTLQYEQLVEDPEGEVRQLLAHCGLDYEERCLRFHATTRPVMTASSEQVRQPLTRNGIDSWRPYADWLGPLRAALAGG